MIDKEYIEAAIETLDLVLQIASHLDSTKQIHNMNNFLVQIQTKAESKISSSLGERLGISIPVDQEGQTAKYWEGVRDMAKLSIKKWSDLNDIPKYLPFLEGTRTNLAAKIGIQAVENPLEDFVGSVPAKPMQPIPEPANPLEDILAPQPTPTFTPTPTPDPVAPQPEPEPFVPVVPKPEPFVPVVPKPEPFVPVVAKPEPVPAPKPIQPEPTPAAIPTIQTPDQLSALDEALQASGMETPIPAEPSSSLSDMLLAKEDTGDKSDEEDDMLSLSLREALKILRDEDED